MTAVAHIAICKIEFRILETRRVAQIMMCLSVRTIVFSVLSPRFCFAKSTHVFSSSEMYYTNVLLSHTV